MTQRCSRYFLKLLISGLFQPDNHRSWRTCGPIGALRHNAAPKFGVEGFSESLSKEVELAGLKVTILRTVLLSNGFAGSSSELLEGGRSMTATVALRSLQRHYYDGKQL